MFEYDDERFKIIEDLIEKSDLPAEKKQKLSDLLYALYEQHYDA